MSYRLVYTHRALKDIQKLEPQVKARTGKALLRFEPDPLGHAKPLSNADLGTYRFRVGDYRIIFDAFARKQNYRWISKKRQMQGAQSSSNEAYLRTSKQRELLQQRSSW